MLNRLAIAHSRIGEVPVNVGITAIQDVHVKASGTDIADV